MEPYIFTRKFKKYSGTRCTMFKPDSYVPLELGKEYYITIRKYGSPAKFGFKKAPKASGTSSKGMTFIVPKIALDDEEALYQVEIFDLSDEEALRNGCLIYHADDDIECIDLGDCSKKGANNGDNA